MRDPEELEGRIPPQKGLLGTAVAALVILVICIWNYWYLIVETNDRVPEVLVPFIAEETGLVLEQDIVSVGVFDSPATRRFFREMRFDYEEIVRNWEVFLRRLGFGYNDFFRIDRINEFDVVILPFTSCLSEYEASVIKDYVARGGKLFMTGAVGSRYEDGRWRDETVFGDIISARFIGNANPSPSGPARLFLNRESPVSLRLTPRHILEVPIYNEVLVVRPIGSRMTTVAKTNFSASEDRLDELTAFNVGPYLKGSVAWSGFRLGAFPPGDEILERAFHELFTNTMIWLTGTPRITMPLWPDDRKAAVGLVVDLDVSKKLRMVERLSRVDYPVGLLVSPSEAHQLRDWPGLDDLDVEWIIHLEEQYLDQLSSPPPNWLSNLRLRMEALMGSSVSGFLPETLRIRQIAEEALDSGFTYMLAPPIEGIDEYPEIYASKRLVGPFEPPEVISLAPFSRALPERVEPTDCSFVVLSTDEFLNEESPISFLTANRDQLWVARPSEIVAWRAHRNSVVLEVEFLPGDRLRLSISNGSYHEFEQLPFRIHFDELVSQVKIWPKAVGDPPPVILSEEGQVWTFALEEFRPGYDHVFIFTPLDQDSMDEEVTDEDPIPVVRKD